MRDDSHHELVLRAEVAAFALKHRLPTIYGSTAAFAEPGGLAMYGPNDLEHYRHTASYVDNLKGAKPGHLPIDQPTKFELVINLKTAKALGLRIPQSSCFEQIR
jgi:putative tryptophan/tyrosine transport system substrate-binding protein